MRISDWSSDVCSSDLHLAEAEVGGIGVALGLVHGADYRTSLRRHWHNVGMNATIYHNARCSKSRATLALLEQHGATVAVIDYLANPPSVARLRELLALLNLRSEEHTSELQSLMRISYAVFC